MKQYLNRHFIIFFSLTVLSLCSFAIRPGGDIYEIYLNKQLLMKQYSTQPLVIKSLHLTIANAADNLVVFYSHCGTTGKDRKLSLRNDQGTVIREWKFADTQGKNGGMSILVKDLLEAKERAHSTLSLFYSSDLMPKGKTLVAFDMSSKATVLQQHEKSRKS